MTGREAIKLVSAVSTRRVVTMHRTTTNATLRQVCEWRLKTPTDFYELADIIKEQDKCRRAS